ncbi:hypothetical protein ACLOJK_033600 [Asimina triloba]
MRRKGSSLNSVAAPGFPCPDQIRVDLQVEKLEEYDYKGTNIMFKQSPDAPAKTDTIINNYVSTLERATT